MKTNIKSEINKQLRRIVSLTLMGSICTVSAFTVGAFSKRVYIQDGDNSVSVVTMNNETEKILEQAGIKVSSNDSIIRVDDYDNSVELTIHRAFDVNILFEGNKITQDMSMGTVADAVEMSGIILNENDYVSPSQDSPLEPGIDINIEKRNKMIVNADGRTKEYSVPITTVKDAISFAEVPIYENDIVSVDLNSQVYDGIEISIERIGYRNHITTETVAYEKTFKESELLDEGVTEVAVKGVNGEREIVVQEVLKDGNIIDSEEIKNNITVKPKNEIILVGNKKKGQTVTTQTLTAQTVSTDSGNLSSPTIHMTSSKYGYSKDTNSGIFSDHNGKSVKYSSKLIGSCTAYTANPGAITSTGRPAQYGNVAVNPNIIPYGSKLYITSADGSFVYGYATAADTGGALMQGLGLVDLYMDSTQQCYDFGRRTMNVYIVK